ncbi:caspase family protein [Dactylosporangium sp. NBC_01737]|uniref:caspase family protein n=1 Tax=Dactylosporangium sp. NBC_01737 TaxID=2975959 RepID=UPI002E10A860|nr:caspase family protein [Dactylosporangium sp. NBC_01737]
MQLPDVPNPLHMAVVVGINRYPGLTDLRSARQDAQRFAEWLVAVDGGGLHPDNVRKVEATGDEAPLDDPFNARPMKVHIDHAIQELEQRAAIVVRQRPDLWKQTRIYVYLAGHGFLPFGGRGALLTAEATANLPGANIEVERYVERLRAATEFHEIVVFMDCCRDFAITVPAGEPTWHLKQGVRKPVKTLVGFAATAGDPAFAVVRRKDSGESRGWFTASLLRALRGDAADPETGLISAVQLAPFLECDLVARSRPGMRQIPEMIGTMTDPIVFGRRSRSEFPVRFHRADVGVELLILDGNLETAGRVKGPDPTVELHLPQARYQLVAQDGRSGSVFTVNGATDVSC